jgi:hypothetical protein
MVGNTVLKPLLKFNEKLNIVPVLNYTPRNDGMWRKEAQFKLFLISVLD